MTKENRERAYLHFRDLEKNYNAIDHLNKGITATQRMRKEAKKNADEILERDLKRPLVEVDGKPSRSVIICGEPEKPKEEVLEKSVEQMNKTELVEYCRVNNIVLEEEDTKAIIIEKIKGSE